jgi:hypothetical protein
MATLSLGPEGPTYECKEMQAEIVRIDRMNFYLYGQVELRLKEDQGERVWTEKLVARGYARDSLRVRREDQRIPGRPFRPLRE